MIGDLWPWDSIPLAGAESCGFSTVHPNHNVGYDSQYTSETSYQLRPRQAPKSEIPGSSGRGSWKALCHKRLRTLGSKHSPNPSKAVRSDRIHAVYHGIPLHGPDESGHYELVVRMLTLGRPGKFWPNGLHLDRPAGKLAFVGHLINDCGQHTTIDQ